MFMWLAKSGAYAEKEGDARYRRWKGRREGGREEKNEGCVPERLRPELDLHQKVVRIHDRVYGVVHGDKVQAGVAGRVREPCVEKHRHVVVPVE